MSTVPPQQNKLVLWFLGAAAAGFFGWSVAVYEAIATVKVVAKQVADIKAEADKHDDRPWHSEAGHLIRLQQKQLERMEAVIARVLHIEETRNP